MKGLLLLMALCVGLCSAHLLSAQNRPRRTASEDTEAVADDGAVSFGPWVTVEVLDRRRFDQTAEESEDAESGSGEKEEQESRESEEDSQESMGSEEESKEDSQESREDEDENLMVARKEEAGEDTMVVTPITHEEHLKVMRSAFDSDEPIDVVLPTVVQPAVMVAAAAARAAKYVIVPNEEGFIHEDEHSNHDAFMGVIPDGRIEPNDLLALESSQMPTGVVEVEASAIPPQAKQDFPVPEEKENISAEAAVKELKGEEEGEAVAVPASGALLLCSFLATQRYVPSFCRGSAGGGGEEARAGAAPRPGLRNVCDFYATRGYLPFFCKTLRDPSGGRNDADASKEIRSEKDVAMDTVLEQFLRGGGLYPLIPKQLLEQTEEEEGSAEGGTTVGENVGPKYAYAPLIFSNTAADQLHTRNLGNLSTAQLIGGTLAAGAGLALLSGYLNRPQYGQQYNGQQYNGQRPGFQQPQYPSYPQQQYPGFQQQQYPSYQQQQYPSYQQQQYPSYQQQQQYPSYPQAYPSYQQQYFREAPASPQPAVILAPQCTYGHCGVPLIGQPPAGRLLPTNCEPGPILNYGNMRLITCRTPSPAGEQEAKRLEEPARKRRTAEEKKKAEKADDQQAVANGEDTVGQQARGPNRGNLNPLVAGGLGLAGGYLLAHQLANNRPNYGSNYYGSGYGGGGYGGGYGYRPYNSYPSYGYGREAAIVADPAAIALPQPTEGRINPLLAGGLGLAAGYYLSSPPRAHYPYYPYTPLAATTSITEIQQPLTYTSFRPAYGIGRSEAGDQLQPIFSPGGLAQPPQPRINPLLAGGLGLAAGYYLVNRYEKEPYYYYEVPTTATTTVTDYPGYHFQQPATYSQYSPAYGLSRSALDERISDQQQRTYAVATVVESPELGQMQGPVPVQLPHPGFGSS